MKIKSPFTAKKYSRELQKQNVLIEKIQADTVAMYAINGWEYDSFDGHNVIMNRNNDIRIIKQDGEVA